MSQPIKQSSGGGAPAIIGQGMIIKGTIQSKQDLFLDGEIEGNLDVENFRLTIGPNGKVFANARAREVEIQGKITGNVESAENTAIRTTGELVGDIRTGGIVIESGALLKGRVEIVSRNRQNGEVKNGE